MDIRTLCLGILTFGDATGYTIKKRLEGPLRHFYDASFGSIYPALRKLTDAGEIGRVDPTARPTASRRQDGSR
jgi:PadR family transcriptional regulator AphA